MDTGIRNRISKNVTKDMTAQALGSGELPVLATPAMVALIEETCWRSVAAELEDGQGTVGTSLNISHLSPTPVGMNFACESELVEIDGRKLTFKIDVYDEQSHIGEGTHERFIVDNERFLEKADSKIMPPEY